MRSPDHARNERASLVPALPPASAEVRAEALKRANQLAAGLFPHQVEGLAFLLGRRRAILADDMGLGKTRQSIVALTESAPSGPWLVVSPASVKRNWAREIHHVRADDLVHVVGPADPLEPGFSGWTVVNYDLLARHFDRLSDTDWKGLVFDEAHYLKNHTSQRSKLARALVERCPDAVLHALTGTPLTNRPRDLFPLLQLVGHPMARSFLSFAKRYCAAIHNGFGWVTDGASNLEELRIQLHGVMLRRTKDEVLELPPKLRSWVPVTVPAGTGRKEARRVLELLIAASLGREAARTAEQAGADAPTAVRDATQDRVRLLAELTKARLAVAKAKVATTIEFVEGVVAQGEKVIVFSAFDEPVKKIAAAFDDRALVLTGATPATGRQKLVDRFQNDESVRVLVANIIAGGVGLNLTAARQVVFNDLDWVPANHWQAEDRAYRIGQRNTVNVTYFSAQDTIDEFVAHVLRTKAALIDAVVEGGDLPGRDILSELEEVFRTLSPELASLQDDGRGEDAVDRLLREVTASFAQRTSQADEGSGRQKSVPLSADAILALARALTGSGREQYRVSSTSKPGNYYSLQIDAGDVTCSCPGFEYRGACTHARILKAAVASGAALPASIFRVA